MAAHKHITVTASTTDEDCDVVLDKEFSVTLPPGEGPVKLGISLSITACRPAGGGGPGVPAAPSDLVATALSSTEIGLVWADNSDDETGFSVEQSADGSTNWAEVATPAADAEAATISGLDPETEYFFRVSAVNAEGSSAASNVDSATTEAAATLTRVTNGLVFSDDYARADGSTPGNGWVERVGDWGLGSGRVFVNITADNRYLEQTGATGGEMFVQSIVHRTGLTGFPGIMARFSHGGVSANGYLMNLASIFRTVNGTHTLLTSGTGAGDANTDYTAQFYVADGVQEGWIDGSSMSAADTTHDGQDSRAIGMRGGGSGSQVRYDDTLWMLNRNIVVSGLPTGYKAKVRNGSASVVAEATESGGTATINASRHGGATETVPFAGWTDLVVTDGSDVVLATYNEAGVYPGSSFTFTE